MSDRRAHYLDVALRLFLERGFNGVSMDQLVAEAGGSKATLYRYFASKEALFVAIIDDVAAPATDDAQEDDWTDVALDDGLRTLGRATASAALDPRTIMLLRLALGEHGRFPQLARALYDHGPARTYRRLRRFLAVKTASGEIAVDDTQIAAEQFLGGIIGHQQLRAALGVQPAGRREIEQRVDAAIRCFTATYRCAATTPTS